MEQEKILNLIQQHFPEFQASALDINFDVNNKLIKVGYRELGKLIAKPMFCNYLNNTFFSDSPSGIFYHYLPSKYIHTIIDGKIRLYHLAKYVKNNNDTKEFSYLFEKLGFDFPYKEGIIESEQKNMFILSCSSAENSQQHFKDYGKEGACCVTFKLKNIINDHTVSIRKVVYEYQLVKLLCLQQCIKEQFEYALNLDPLFNYLQFVKRSYYEWEQEIRICFNNGYHLGTENINSLLGIEKDINSSLNNYFTIKKDENNDEFIEVPLINDYFDLTIESIQMSSNNLDLEIIAECVKKGIKFESIKMSEL
jgi:hypothetical protein